MYSIRTSADFHKALGALDHGQRLIYHVGDLRSDAKRFRPIFDIGKAAWDAYEAGECLLVQRRVSESRFEYIAVRLSPPRPVTFVGCYGPKWELHREAKAA